MPSISANALFHFTSSAQKLASILANDFWPNYHHEKIYLRADADYELFIPMVSFCDIPLSQISQHIERYGHYGLGMSKEWGIRNGLNPVLYLNADSILANDLHAALKATFLKEGVDALLNSQRCIKEYKDADTCYYNEREWMYVAPEKILQHPPSEEGLAALNQKVRFRSLSFEPQDIRYVVTKNREDIPNLIQDIFRLKSNRSQDEKLLVISKIISCEDITEDF